MEPHAEMVIARLTEEGFINENRYAQSFTREKIRYNRWGRVKVAQALRLKEIPADIIRKAVGAFDEEEYKEILQQLLQSKARTVSARSEYEKHGKLIRFALSRGFEMPLITRHLHVEEDFGLRYGYGAAACRTFSFPATAHVAPDGSRSAKSLYAATA